MSRASGGCPGSKIGSAASEDHVSTCGGRRGTAMLWPRDTCPFGLPDEVDLGDAPAGDLLLASIGRVLRATAADTVEAPLPLQLASLLRRLGRPQRPARRSPAGRKLPPGARSQPAPAPAERRPQCAVLQIIR